jgi:hypothetical protein
MVEKERIIIPDHSRPGENADEYADPNPEQHPDK